MVDQVGLLIKPFTDSEECRFKSESLFLGMAKEWQKCTHNMRKESFQVTPFRESQPDKCTSDLSILENSSESNSKKGIKRKKVAGNSSCVEGRLSPHIDMDIDDSFETVPVPSSSPTSDPDELSDVDEEDYVSVEFADVSPVNWAAYNVRERLPSMTESEDSFIVFQSGTEEELVFSESEDDTDSDESEQESEPEFDSLDSATSVIPNKRVRFADDNELCEVHNMVQWSFAYQQARKGPWEEHARDRDRFNRRIWETGRVLGSILNTQHRTKIYEERFKNAECCGDFDEGYSSQKSSLNFEQ